MKYMLVGTVAVPVFDDQDSWEASIEPKDNKDCQGPNEEEKDRKVSFPNPPKDDVLVWGEG